jgi:phosphoribosylglycinamide formyltransferase-1
VSDRQCPAIEKAIHHGVRADVILESRKHEFCMRLLEYLEVRQIDYVISFFTKLFVGDLLKVYRDRIINLHPSLLPAFKGMNGFHDAVNYGARYVGSTIHFIDQNMDAGKTIMQTVCPLDVNKDIHQIRHKIFEQQCRSLLQVVKWLADGRITIEADKVIVKNAVFTDYEFAPSLDFEDAIRLSIAFDRQVFSNPVQLEDA